MPSSLSYADDAGSVFTFGLKGGYEAGVKLVSVMAALLPIASGLEEGSELLRSVAVVLIGGLLTSTLLTHFLAERIRANPRISGSLEKLAGVFLIAFGVKLAISR